MPGDARDRTAGAWRRVALPLVLLGGWLAAGTLGFVLLERYPLFDAFYMTVITLSTVGYGEIHPLSPAGRAFASVLIMGGLGTVLYALTRVGQMLIEGELADVYGARRMRRTIENLTDHHILCGYGRTARPVVEALRDEALDFVVVERDPEIARQIQDAGDLVHQGDATDEDALRAAGVARAKGLLALLPSDADNLYLTMTAKGLNPNLRVIARASDEKAEAKLRRAGADDVVMPYRMAGQRVIQAITQPHVLEFMEAISRRTELALSMEEVRVPEGSPLAGSSLGDSHLRRRTGAIVVAIRGSDGRMRFNPAAEERVQVGDVLLALGPADDLRKLDELVSHRRSGGNP